MPERREHRKDHAPSGVSIVPRSSAITDQSCSSCDRLLMILCFSLFLLADICYGFAQ